MTIAHRAGTILILTAVASGCSPGLEPYTVPDSFPVLSGPYLGQAPPGSTPEIFAPGILSHGFHEHGLALSPDGRELFFATADVGYGHYTIIRLARSDDLWSPPEVAPFSGDQSDLMARFSPDGRRLYFASRRPLVGEQGPKADFDIWSIEKTADGWSEPACLGSAVNTPQDEAQPSVSADGTLYFQAGYDEATANDLYASRLQNGRYGTPEKLPDGLNTEHNESAPFIAPDESYLIFQSNRPGGVGSLDLYVAFRTPDGSWDVPVNLGPGINSPAADGAATVSPDGRYLFFQSYRRPAVETYRGKSYAELLELYRRPENGYATLYWVDAGILKELGADRPKGR